MEESEEQITANDSEKMFLLFTDKLIKYQHPSNEEMVSVGKW